MKKKSIILRLFAATMGIFVVVLLLMVINSLYGNPISATIARKKIQSYIANAYPDNNLIVDKATYNFKNSSYGSVVHSPTSEDTTFRVYERNGRIEDDYAYEIANQFTTYRRLEDALDQEVEAIIKKEFPYPMRLIGAKMFDVPDYEQYFTLDMPYHIQELPLPVEVLVWTSADEPSYEILAERLLELKSLMERYKIPVEYYSMNLEHPYHEENGELMPEIFDSLSVNRYHVVELVDRPDLPVLLEEHVKAYEAEGEKEKEAEIENASEYEEEIDSILEKMK